MYIHTNQKCWWTTEFIKYVNGNSCQISSGHQLITQRPRFSSNAKTHTLCSLLLNKIIHMPLKLIEEPGVDCSSPDFPPAFWKMKGEIYLSQLQGKYSMSQWTVTLSCLSYLPLHRVTWNMFICLPSSIWCCTYMTIFYCYISTSLYISSVINECDWSSLQASACCMMELWILACCLNFRGLCWNTVYCHLGRCADIDRVRQTSQLVSGGKWNTLYWQIWELYRSTMFLQYSR